MDSTGLDIISKLARLGQRKQRVVVWIRIDSGSDIFSNTPGNDVKISIRNSDHCFVFRSELIVISGALDDALNSNKDRVWILINIRSSIQYLKNWPKIMDSTGLDIISKLARFAQMSASSGYCRMWSNVSKRSSIYAYSNDDFQSSVEEGGISAESSKSSKNADYTNKV
ncbi:RNase H domain-containing protein [Trichonephila clavipes]|nr:RNase H domain-containing protein [Trichonephila clavipes]